MNKLMLSCLKATELVEKSNIVSLSMMERFQLRIHLRMCDACKKYLKQSKALDMFTQQLISNAKGQPTLELSHEVKQEIIKKLTEQKAP